jgi:hypothetical protein
VNLSFLSSRFQKADDLKGGGGGKGRRQKQDKKTKVLQKSKFCLDGFVGCWKFGWLAGQLVRWFVADSLPDF